MARLQNVLLCVCLRLKSRLFSVIKYIVCNYCGMLVDSACHCGNKNEPVVRLIDDLPDKEICIY